jgi:hypothetical protein
MNKSAHSRVRVQTKSWIPRVCRLLRFEGKGLLDVFTRFSTSRRLSKLAKSCMLAVYSCI